MSEKQKCEETTETPQTNFENEVKKIELKKDLEKIELEKELEKIKVEEDLEKIELNLTELKRAKLEKDELAKKKLEINNTKEENASKKNEAKETPVVDKLSKINSIEEEIRASAEKNVKVPYRWETGFLLGIYIVLCVALAGIGWIFLIAKSLIANHEITQLLCIFTLLFIGFIVITTFAWKTWNSRHNSYKKRMASYEQDLNELNKKRISTIK